MTAPLKESTLDNFMDRLRIKQRRIPLQGTVDTTFRCNLA